MLEWLEQWYIMHCNEEDDYYKIRISTIDNPGWMVEIDLQMTTLAHKYFHAITDDFGDNDWLYCKVENGEFVGVGDPTKLRTIMMIFRNWAEESR